MFSTTCMLRFSQMLCILLVHHCIGNRGGWILMEWNDGLTATICIFVLASFPRWLLTVYAQCLFTNIFPSSEYFRLYSLYVSYESSGTDIVSELFFAYLVACAVHSLTFSFSDEQGSAQMVLLFLRYSIIYNCTGLWDPPVRGVSTDSIFFRKRPSVTCHNVYAQRCHDVAMPQL